MCRVRLSLPLAVVALLVGGCGADGAETAGADSEPRAQASGGGELTPGADPPEAALAERDGRGERSLELATKGHPAVWVLPGERAELREEPGGEVLIRVERRTEFGSPSVFSVAERRGDWVGVTSPELANNQLGWLRLDPRVLGSGTSRFSILVDLSDHTTTLMNDGDVVRSFAVTIGAPGSETPTGSFAVTDVFDGGLGPAYGCCAVAISANQPRTPSGWIGGRRIAIHGTDDTLGIDASHGCVRASDADVQALVDRVPLGTPVEIRQ